MTVGGRLSAVSVWDTVTAVLSLSFSFCLSASLKDSLSSPFSWSSPSGCSGTSYPSQLLSPPCDQLTRFMLLAGLHLISAISYAIEAQVSVSLATQAALAECYGQWSLFCYFKQLGNVHQHDLPHYLLLAEIKFSAKSPPSSLLMMTRVVWVW